MRHLTVLLAFALVVSFAWGKKNISDYPLRVKVIAAEKAETTREIKSGTEGETTKCTATDSTMNCDTTPKHPSTMVLHGSRTTMSVELGGHTYTVSCLRSAGLVTRHIGNCGILPAGEYPGRWKNGHDKLELLDGDKSVVYELVEAQ